jgi:hypothetical protein
MSETTIGVSKRLKQELIRHKHHKNESYEEVVWRILKKN